MNTSYCDAQSCLLNSKISSAGTASCEQMTEPHKVMTTQLNLLDKASSKFPKVTCWNWKMPMLQNENIRQIHVIFGQILSG